MSEVNETIGRFAEKRAEFPALNRTLGGVPLAYFDGPGGSQVPRSVIQAVSRYYETCNANTHGAFITSKESDQIIEQARLASAELLNASGPEAISFGANMTTLAFSLSRAFARRFQPGDEILITQLDHEANRGPWLTLREHGMIVREVRMTEQGVLDYGDFDAKLNEHTRLVAVGWASNALGTVNDLSYIRRRSWEVGAFLLVDAVHYAPHFPIDFQAQGFDFLLCSAYKFYGPHVGILCSRANLLGQLDTDRLRTQEYSAPYRIETGTLNHAAIAGAAAAIDFIADLGEGPDRRTRIVSAMERVERHEHALAEGFHQSLCELPGVQLYGPDFTSPRRAPTVSLRIAGKTPAEVADHLARKGLLVWDGDFYATRAVELLGLADSGGLVRVGMSLYNTGEEVERLVDGVRELV